MGMNPRCVQTETTLAHKAIKNKEVKENKQYSSSPPEKERTTQSTTFEPTTTNADIMTLCTEYDKCCTIGIQTEDNGYIKDVGYILFDCISSSGCWVCSENRFLGSKFWPNI